MSFRIRLVIGHIALLFVTIVTGMAAVIAMRVSSARLERVARGHTADMAALHDLHFEADQVVTTSRVYALTGDDESYDRFRAVEARVNASLAVLDDRRQALGDRMTRLDEAARTYLAVAKHAAQQHTAETDPRVLLRSFETALSPARARFDAALTELVDQEQTAFAHESIHARDFADLTLGVVITTTAFGSVLGAALAWFSIRRLGMDYARELEATTAARRAAAARDELLAIVSHDLRNPLTTIATGTSLLEETVASAREHKYVTAIGNAATRMQGLIDQLLDVAKLDTGNVELHPEPCDVASLFEATLAMFQLRANDAQVELSVDADAVPPVRADRERVLQILSNLLGNALKFTGAGGQIALRARPEGDAVRIEVADTGPGIPADQVPHLFERYWQGRPRGRGSLGLGLYICKQLVEAHHGRIDVETAPGAGSTFWFTLPARAA